MVWNDLIGQSLGQYTILEEIGRGGSSRVYRGHDAESQRDVAIKVIANDGEDRVGFVKRFEREVQAVAQLNHPNIVTVYDRGETDDFVYLVMQCVMGGTLRQKLGRPLPIPEAVSAAIQIAHALHHAHLRGIVHRDVKPSNVLIAAENQRHLLLTDFGIAKVLGTRGLTKTGTTIGTPEYMAPEQAEGKDIDPRADVYSLGCVLYETLAGRPPFIGSTPVSVLYQQVHSRPAYIRGFNPDVPRDLTRVIELALAKRPDDRYGTAERLAEALQPFAGGRSPAPTPTARPAGQTTPTRPSLHPEPLVLDPLDTAAALAPPSTPSPTAPAPSASADALTPPERSETTKRLADLGLVMPAAPSSGGLGAEGLDAIFPDDPEAQRPAQSAASPQSTLPPTSALPPAGGGDQTIPRPPMRRPTSKTQPLETPLTSTGELDLERLLAERHAPTYQPGSPLSADRYDLAAGQSDRPSDFMPDYSTLFQDAASPAPGGPEEEWSLANRQEHGEQPSASLRGALLHTPRHGTPREVWRPPVEGQPVDTRIPSLRPRQASRRPLWTGLTLVAVLVLLIGTWVGVSASGLGVTLFGHAQPTPVPTLSPTPAPPTPTLTPSATATATTNPQISIDKQAAAAFRSVILASFADSSCSSGNARSHFFVGQAVYVDLCETGNAPGGLVTVEIRQGGQTVYTLASGQYIGPGTFRYYYRVGLNSGQYDMRVRFQWNGNTGTARDIAFSVG